MSGFEVAGIVLGAFPLVISGLEQVNFIHFRRKLSDDVLPDLTHCESEKYAEIARRCIMGSFSSIRPTLKENAAFQEQFYMTVVEPLAQIYNVLK